MSTKIFTTSDNAAILDKWAGKVNLSAKKKANLLSEMSEDEELTKLIHTNPEFNIKRWLNTRNHVDQTKLAKVADGNYVKNGRVYAGNVYYFNHYYASIYANSRFWRHLPLTLTVHSDIINDDYRQNNTIGDIICI